jgi:hypothetical protein
MNLKIAALLLPLALTTGCMGGKVVNRNPGQSAVNLTVTVRTCAGNFTTTTGSNGEFHFDPFDPFSADVDASQQVPEGPVLVVIQDGSHTSYYPFDHRYDRLCKIPYNGDTNSWLPCSQTGFVFASPSVALPANETGPNGEAVYHPISTGYCPSGNIRTCRLTDILTRTAVERAFVQRCIIGQL